jgi:hypothetical protein
MMKRRRYLFSLLAVSIPGCLGDSPSEDTDDSGEDNQPDVSRDIFVTVSNERSQRVTASVVVTDSADSIIAERTVELEPDESTAVYTGITEPGDYPYNVYLEGELAFAATYSVGKFDIEMGSNIDIAILADDLEISAAD